jgi:acetylglutamate kinase
MNRLFVIKIGGNIIDDEAKLAHFLGEFAQISEKKILVHGGGKLATRLAGQLGIEQTMIEGRRITGEQTLKIVTMVYAGYINKNITAQLQKHGCNAIGICGVDGNAITAHKRVKGAIDYGFAGDIDAVNDKFIVHLLEQGNDIVFAPITHDKKGQLLNTNADTIAQEIATSLSKSYDVSLVFGFEKAGVLRNAEDDATVIPAIDATSYQQLKNEQVIFAGMIPKLDNAFAAIGKGVKKVLIGKAENLLELTEGKSGTAITHTS